MAWLTNWNYRKAVTISNTGSALTDYQTSITIDTATLVTALKMRSDCGDIRFTNDDGSTLLNYWIESGINTNSTKIWIKIPSIPTGTKTIYIYYGNPNVVSASDGATTFIQWHGATSASFVDAGVAQMNVIYEAIVKVDSSNYTIDWGISDSLVDNGGNQVVMKMVITNARLYATIWHSDVQLLYQYTAGAIAPNTYYRLSFTRSANYTTFYINGVPFMAGLSSTLPDTNMGLFMLIYSGTGDQLWSFIRKYAVTEPTTILEAEQISPNITTTNMTITPSETPCRVGICTVTVNVTWTNNGGTSGDFIPNITIDGTPYLSPYPLESLGSGLSVTKTFVVSGLTVGIRSICPYPN